MNLVHRQPVTGLGEECGIFAVMSRNDLDVARMAYYGLYSLQHRGQESCGIVVNDDDGTHCHKELGLVSEVFTPGILDQMKGRMAIGHVRYSTTGGNSRQNAQPLAIQYVKGTLSIAHNGNISNASKLRKDLETQGAIFQSTSDTEVIAFLIARERLKTKTVEEAIARVVPQLQGAFSLLIMSPKKLIAVRDPYGIRPLCMGKLEDSIVFASESCALDAVHAEYVRDIDPGEIVVVHRDREESMRMHCNGKTAMCIFEHIYFARTDSVIDGQSVYEARLEAGRILALGDDVKADMVMGVPDSGLVAAMGYAQAAGIPFGEGLVKNRYVGRTFIQPTQATREASVAIKLNALSHNVRGKSLIVIDDSIVRGTTMTQIVAMLKRAGAREVHIRISSPTFRFPCYFGTDISSRDQLALGNGSPEELRERIGANTLKFLPLDQVKAIAKHSGVSFCDACFSGDYPFEVPRETDKMAFEHIKAPKTAE